MALPGFGTCHTFREEVPLQVAEKNNKGVVNYGGIIRFVLLCELGFLYSIQLLYDSEA